ncbi:virginiamycin B lyase family protein [Bacillus sp. WLY-B-L8]|uniref:virginiamycin B lyase family protein n=1 Tax=Bacillus multifaciens TaxID=3068506 RepID=UPI0027407DA6|nr:hypothetical protein [Bacillus sp. WLY-B-L8]MDP7979513.1 hypothetical protein [Bacillus sp. WLY-B-L8]HDX9590351.1 hypothetical protein [Bacillus pseudomycoides]
MQIKINEYRLPMAELGPYGITVGVDRALWFTEHKGNRIGRMTVTGEIGPDGAIWFAEECNQIGQLICL